MLRSIKLLLFSGQLTFDVIVLNADVITKSKRSSKGILHTLTSAVTSICNNSTFDHVFNENLGIQSVKHVKSVLFC
jgi:hypothetical protein